MSPYTKQGRLEVYQNGEWGTVCDDARAGHASKANNDGVGGDQGDNNMAIVVCRMLGLTGGVVKTDKNYGAGTGSIVMTKVGCSGNEKTIFDCPYAYAYAYARNGCRHNEDVGVACN